MPHVPTPTPPPTTSTALASATFDLAVIGKTRGFMVDLLRAHTLAQVNRVPPGFRNNLIWNARHCYVSLYLLVFARNNATAAEMATLGYAPPSEEEVAAYRKGTAPEGEVDAAAVEHAIGRLGDMSWAARLTDAFLDSARYDAYDASWGVRLHSAAEAIAYVNMHEGMHLGVMLAQRKLL